MNHSTTVPLGEVLTQRTDEVRIINPAVERYVTVRLYGKGAVLRTIGEGKTPIMRSGYRIKSGDLIYSRIDARNGAFAMIPDALDGAVVSKDFPNFSIRCDKIDPNFLIRFLASERFFTQLRRSSFGTTNRQRISESVFLSYHIPLPSLQEQRRIGELLCEADELRRLRSIANERTIALVPAIFNQMFGDVNQKSMPWPVQQLGMAVDLISGGTPSKDDPDFWNGNTPWVSPKDMKGREIADTIDHVGQAAFERTSLRLLPKDTVLIVVRGMILIHTVPIAICRVPVAINQDIKALIPKRQMVPEFLRSALMVQHSSLLNQVSTASHGTRRIETADLRSIRLPIPPIALQNEFAVRVKQVTELTVTQAACRDHIERLGESMLHRAFNGEL